MYGGTGFWGMVTPAVKNLIIINTIILIATSLIGENTMYQAFALFPFESPLFRPWQIVSHLFMHGGFWHLFFNMYTLMIFGPVLERMWGSNKFLVFYFVTGIGAALCHEFVMHLQIAGVISSGKLPAIALMSVPTVGASGAIYGVLLGYAMLYPNSVMQLLFPPVALKAKWMVVVFAAIEILTGVTGTGGGIAHFAHLGGMLFALILILIWKQQGRMYS